MKMIVQEELGRKGADINKVAEAAMDNPDLINELIEGIQAPKGTLRYGYEKVLRRISKRCQIKGVSKRCQSYLLTFSLK